MVCPICLKKDTKVLDSRLVDEGFAVRRRRECQSCGFRFSTFEKIEILNLTVIKRDGRKEMYSQDKLESGLRKALEKRPYTKEDYKKLLNRIERDIQKKSQDEITSQDIGKIVAKHLKKFDKVAYIRFASVYYDFADVDSFHQEVKSLIKKDKS